MTKNIKLSAYLFIATGILHNALGFALGYPVLAAMLQDGLFNSTQMQFDRESIFWFLFSGFALILIGFLMFELKRIPKSFSYGLLFLSCVGAFIMPVSGFWLVIGLCLHILWHQRAVTSKVAAQVL